MAKVLSKQERLKVEEMLGLERLHKRFSRNMTNSNLAKSLFIHAMESDPDKARELLRRQEEVK